MGQKEVVCMVVSVQLSFQCMLKVCRSLSMEMVKLRKLMSAFPPQHLNNGIYGEKRKEHLQIGTKSVSVAQQVNTAVQSENFLLKSL